MTWRLPSRAAARRAAILFVCVLLPMAVWLRFGVTTDVGDGVNHYLAAHLAIAHPSILLDAWCKPLFTLLAAPFAWLGFTGMVLFQALVTLASAALLWQIGRWSGLRYAWLAPLLLYAQPGAVSALLSGLTEPLFALVLVAALWACERGRLGWAYVFIGLSPFVRAEGWVLMLWWGLFALYQRRWRLLFPLACGHIAYAIVGTLLVHHDPLWMFHQNPYWIESKPYGHGTWLHFVHEYPFVAGAPLAWLTVVAMVLLIARCVGSRLTGTAVGRFGAASDDERRLGLEVGSFLAYFSVHVVFWRFGIFNSFGLPRVLVAILPVAALVVSREWHVVVHRAPARLGSSVTWALAVALLSFEISSRPTALRPNALLAKRTQQMVIDQAAARLRTLYPKGETRPLVFFSHPYAAFVLDLDILDHGVARSCSRLKNEALVPGALVLWDSWFSVVEHGVTPEDLAGLKLEASERILEEYGQERSYEAVIGRIPVRAAANPERSLER